MYIVYPCKKDTYITNRLYLNTDGRYANFGKSSTLDLYKIHNENTKKKQQAIFKILSKPTDQIEFSFRNYLNVNYVFKFDHATSPEDSGTIINSKIIIGLNGLTDIDEISVLIKDTINTPYRSVFCDIHKETGLIAITQDKSDFVGNINLNIPLDNSIEMLQDFSRNEYSIGLLQFDLSSNNQY